MTKQFCHTCNSVQDCDEDNSYSVEFYCKRCESNVGQVPFNRSKWWLCGCDNPLVDNEYVRTEVEEEMVFIYFKATCYNCKETWEWREYVSFNILPEEVKMLKEEEDG